jgi:hypothetical protein
MADIAQINKIISEINDLEEDERLLFFRKMEELYDNSDDRQDNGVSIESVFGLWKNRNITKETLRKKAWMKN